MKMRWILIPVILVVLIAIGFLALLLYSRSHVLDKDGMINESVLTYVSYTKGGGMDGGHHFVTLKRQDDETALLTVSYLPYYGTKETNTTETVSADVLDKISAVFVQYNMEKWADCPKSDLIALDAPSTGYSFEFGSTTYRFSLDQELPQNAGDALSQINALLNIQ